MTEKLRGYNRKEAMWYYANIIFVKKTQKKNVLNVIKFISIRIVQFIFYFILFVKLNTLNVMINFILENANVCTHL